AARAERARERLPGMIAGARSDAEAARALLERARRGEATPEEVRHVLPEPARTRPEPGGPSLPYRVFRSSGGLEIRVGRGARHNDDLTFHHSDPDDVWLHARHAAGAHVILRWQGDGSPPARDLAEAAVLAALHSRARTSGSVPVDWTRRKYVRKPRKAPPGRVAPDRVRTLFVEPDPSLEERLAEP
ncbi:MAG TPA: NFACT RNA binding domain-containing protein, partial [Longimicrobiales bacterium]|nr:NFACT RNA binding domain-containing protein [Longimicrobiales bacterium]